MVGQVNAILWVGDRDLKSPSTSEKGSCSNQNAYGSLGMYDKSKPRLLHQKYGQLQTA